MVKNLINLRLVVIYFMWLPLISCASSIDNHNDYLSPNMLNFERYAEKSVFVKGYVVLGTNSRCLYVSKKRYSQMKNDFENNFPAFQNNYTQDKITLLYPDIIWRYREKLNGKTLVLKGKFINNYDYEDGNPLDLQACSSNALVIDEEHLKENLK